MAHKCLGTLLANSPFAMSSLGGHPARKLGNTNMATIGRGGRLIMPALSICLLLASIPASGADSLSVTDFGNWAVANGVVPGGSLPDRLSLPIGQILTAPTGIPKSGSA